MFWLIFLFGTSTYISTIWDWQLGLWISLLKLLVTVSSMLIEFLTCITFFWFPAFLSIKIFKHLNAVSIIIFCFLNSYSFVVLSVTFTLNVLLHPEVKWLKNSMFSYCLSTFKTYLKKYITSDISTITFLIYTIILIWTTVPPSSRYQKIPQGIKTRNFFMIEETIYLQVA